MPGMLKKISFHFAFGSFTSASLVLISCFLHYKDSYTLYYIQDISYLF